MAISADCLLSLQLPHTHFIPEGPLTPGAEVGGWYDGLKWGNREMPLHKLQFAGSLDKTGTDDGSCNKLLASHVENATCAQLYNYSNWIRINASYGSEKLM